MKSTAIEFVKEDGSPAAFTTNSTPIRDKLVAATITTSEGIVITIRESGEWGQPSSAPILAMTKECWDKLVNNIT